jgi:hypothetical protein
MSGERRFVLAFLTKKEEGEYALEDLSARLPADLSGADQTDGWFTGARVRAWRARVGKTSRAPVQGQSWEGG